MDSVQIGGTVKNVSGLDASKLEFRETNPVGVNLKMEEEIKNADPDFGPGMEICMPRALLGRESCCASHPT